MRHKLRKRYGRAAGSSWQKLVASREKTLTDSEIRKLRDSAGSAGDLKQVKLCGRALDGSRRARLACADVIADYEGNLKA